MPSRGRRQLGARREALAAAALITGGNFRLVARLFGQVAPILQINGLTTLTSEVVETARRSERVHLVETVSLETMTTRPAGGWARSQPR